MWPSRSYFGMVCGNNIKKFITLSWNTNYHLKRLRKSDGMMINSQTAPLLWDLSHGRSVTSLRPGKPWTFGIPPACEQRWAPQEGPESWNREQTPLCYTNVIYASLISNYIHIMVRSLNNVDIPLFPFHWGIVDIV